MRMDKDICKVMFNEVELQGVCKRLGEQITKDYEGKDLLIVGILNGAIVFVTDLMRQIDRQINIDFMSVSSYGNGTTSSGNIHVAKDLNSDIAGRNVLIVEDILDTGNTLHQLTKMLKERNPASLKVCVLLDKPARREQEIYADYVGYTIPDAFVVGYGLDYAEEYRNLPYIGVLSPSVYSHELIKSAQDRSEVIVTQKEKLDRPGSAHRAVLLHGGPHFQHEYRPAQGGVPHHHRLL